MCFKGMLTIDIISVQPNMFRGFLEESIVGRAVKKGACRINIINLRDFSEGPYRKVDDKIYGGGPGMLMMCPPWFRAVESRLAESESARVIMTSPAGRKFDQRTAEELSKSEHIVFMCGHYEGFDKRIETLATDMFSLGDFVMTGGELAAAAMVDATVRLTDRLCSLKFSEPVKTFSCTLASPRYTMKYLGLKENEEVLKRLANAPFTLYTRVGIWNHLGAPDDMVDFSGLYRVYRDYPETCLGIEATEWDANFLQKIVNGPTSRFLTDLRTMMEIPCDRDGMVGNLYRQWQNYRKLNGSRMSGMSGGLNFQHFGLDRRGLDVGNGNGQCRTGGIAIAQSLDIVQHSCDFKGKHVQLIVHNVLDAVGSQILGMYLAVQLNGGVRVMHRADDDGFCRWPPRDQQHDHWLCAVHHPL